MAFYYKRLFTFSALRFYSQKVAQPLRSKKPKSATNSVQNFVDFKRIRATAGNGGNGCISFLHLWSNEMAGPDGGDGGNGGHVVLKATHDVTDFTHVSSILKADSGDNGRNKDCNGKNANHLEVVVPVGTVVKNRDGKVVGDLSDEGMMFVAARGGAGGKGNHFFISDTEQSPEICEYGAEGEDLQYSVELKSMAHIGLIGFPNAGKSTLLRAISRAHPKIAPYPFTTLKPHIGMIQYEDYEQVAVADLPGLIPGSHKNKGLGIQFLRHTERCSGLLLVLDVSAPNPWEHLDALQYELGQFSGELIGRPKLVVANKIDLDGDENLEELRRRTDLKVIGISAKHGNNLATLLNEIRLIYDNRKSNK